MLRTNRKILLSGSQSDITRQASWCHTVTLGTDFSIYTSQPWQILIFSHLCLYEIGFLPVRETSISHDAGPRNNPLKGGRKRILHEPVHAEQGNLTLGEEISTRYSASLVPVWNFYPSGEISLSCMDTHYGFLYSDMGKKLSYRQRWENIMIYHWCEG